VEQLQATVAELQKQVAMTRHGRSPPGLGIEANATMSNPRARAPELRGPAPYR
jgi:hypothetical protein